MHTLLQQSAPVVQPCPSGTHGFTGGLHVPVVQLPEQQSQLVAQVPAFAVQGVLQTLVCGSQMPWQQLASTVQVAPSGLQAVEPQRSGFCVLSQMPEQHPI